MVKQTIHEPIFMIGMGRSGTTAISEAISLHEDLGWFSVYIQHVPALPWLAVIDRITMMPKIGWYLRGKKKQQKGIGNLLRRYLPYPIETYSVWERFCGQRFSYDYLIGQKASEDQAECLTKYIRRVLALQGKKRFFAKFTGPPRIEYLNSVFPDAYYVHVVRDPRAVVSSLVKYWSSTRWKHWGWLDGPWWSNGLPDEYVQEWKKNDRSPVALAAVQWKRVVELAWEEKNLIDQKKYLEIQYEDFVAAPHQRLSDVFERLNLTDSQTAHRYITSVGRLRNMNFKYKEDLRSDQIALVEKLTHDIAQRAGYHFEVNGR